MLLKKTAIGLLAGTLMLGCVSIAYGKDAGGKIQRETHKAYDEEENQKDLYDADDAFDGADDTFDISDIPPAEVELCCEEFCRKFCVKDIRFCYRPDRLSGKALFRVI